MPQYRWISSICTIMVLVWVAMLFSCQQAPQSTKVADPNRVVATINGEEVLQSDLDAVHAFTEIGRVVIQIRKMDDDAKQLLSDEQIWQMLLQQRPMPEQAFRLLLQTYAHRLEAQRLGLVVPEITAPPSDDRSTWSQPELDEAALNDRVTGVYCNKTGISIEQNNQSIQNISAGSSQYSTSLMKHFYESRNIENPTREQDQECMDYINGLYDIDNIYSTNEIIMMD